MRENELEIGLAFDGDGDRVGVIDDEGTVIWPDRQMVLFSRDVLERNPGARIIYDVKCSKVLPTAITEAGGVPDMWKTGHSFIKARIKETGALLGGEMSGHMFFKERWYGFDDALYAAARLLEILSRTDRKASEIFGEIPDTINTPELNVAFERDGAQHDFIEAFVANATFEGADAHHDRRRARRLPGRLRSGARLEHHALARDPLRGGGPGRARAHPGRVPRRR